MDRRRKHFNAEEIMTGVLELLKKRLDVLDDKEYIGNVFARGELYAYRECLKMAMAWKGAQSVWGKEYSEWDITARSGLRINPYHTIKSKRERALENFNKNRNKDKDKDDNK